MKNRVYLLFVLLILMGCQNVSPKENKEIVKKEETISNQEIYIKDSTKENKEIIKKEETISNQGIFIKDSSDYTQDFLNALNQEGIEVEYLIDNMLILGVGDTIYFPELPKFGDWNTFYGKKDNLEIELKVKRRNYNSIAFDLEMSLLGKTAYNKKGIAEFGPLFYFGAETDENVETGNSYLSTEYYSSDKDCIFNIRIGKEGDTGEILCKIIKNCNNKIQDITLDNFPNLKLKKD